MLIGSSLAQIPIKEVFLEKRLYPYTFIKQIIIPIIFFLILKHFVTNELILGIIIIVSAMPVATITIMFCNEYEGNINLASKTIFITTLCSVVTIPVLVYILLI
ncbi:AEC family transporter, partial [Clostridium perfringens]